MIKVSVWLLVLLLLPSMPASAQSSLPASCSAPLTKTNKVITNETFSATGLTVPSLWWAKEQFDPFAGELVDSWRADAQKRLIDLIVNRQLWSLLDYLNRYRFVNNFGMVARNYQYNLRVFNQQQQCLATYTCDFSSPLPQCHINFPPQESIQFEVE